MKTLDWTPNTPDTTGWKARHLAAIAHQQGFELPIVRSLAAWIDYAEAHQRRYESPIGQDYVLGPAWARWGFALHELLNGETGRLDCGTLSRIINANLTEQGFDTSRGAPDR